MFSWVVPLGTLGGSVNRDEEVTCLVTLLD